MKKIRLTTAFLPALAVFLVPLLSACTKTPPQAKTPDQVVQNVAQELSAYQPQFLWNALPGSYRKDVETLVHESADRMDKEIWNKGFALTDKALLVLKSKKELLLQWKLFNNNTIDPNRLSANWDNIIGTAEVITKSELADLEKLRRLDVEKFLAGTGARLMKKLDDLSGLNKDEKFAPTFKKLKSIKTAIVKQDQEKATLKIEIPEEVSWEIPFVKVEDKWVPKPLADQWSIEIGKVIKEIAEFSSRLTKEEKQRVLGVMTSLDGILEQMLAAKTTQDLESAMAQALGLFIGHALGKG